MRIAVVCSAHGFGHVGRQLALIGALHQHEITLFTAAPKALVAMPGLTVVPWQVDVGIVQRDSLTEDPEATREGWRQAVLRVDALAEQLVGFDRVVVDIAPTGLEAARRAGVPALAVGNFDWAWIYERYPALAEFVPQMRGFHAAHRAVQLRPGPDLTGFAQVTEVSGPLARLAEPHPFPRGFAHVLVAFGGLGLSDLHAWLPTLPGVRWVLAPPCEALDRPDVVMMPDVAFPSLLSGADLVLTKPGYGVLAEAQRAGVRLCWVDRGVFPEAPYIEAAMLARGDVKVVGQDVRAGVLSALSRPRPSPVETNAATTIAALVSVR